MKRVHWLGVGVTAACILFLAACSAPSSSPAGTAKAFLHALASGDGDTAVSLLYFGDIENQEKAAMAKKKIKIMIPMMQDKFEKMGGIESIQINGVEKVDANHADVHMTILFGNGEKKSDSMDVVRHDGQWYIDM